MNKLYKLTFVAGIILSTVACLNTPPEKEDYGLYFEGSRPFEVGTIDVKEKSGKLSFTWNTDSSVGFLIKTLNTVETRIKIDLNTDPISGLRKIDCEIDAAYTEIACFNKNGDLIIDYTNITRLLDELPTELFFGANFYDESGDIMSYSSFTLALK